MVLKSTRNAPRKMKAQNSIAFTEAARELGCDEDPAHFDEILKKVVRHNPAPNALSEPKKPKTKKPDGEPSPKKLV